MIALFAIEEGFPLKVPSVRQLFNAIAADLDGTIEDDDIESPSSFDVIIREKIKPIKNQKSYPKTQTQQ